MEEANGGTTNLDDDDDDDDDGELHSFTVVARCIWEPTEGFFGA